MTYENKTNEILEGQSNNLAFQHAISVGRTLDFKFVAETAFAIEEFLKLKRRANREQFIAALENPKLVELLKELNEAVK